MNTATAIVVMLLAAPAVYLGARLGRFGVDRQLRELRRRRLPGARVVRR